MLSGVTTEKHLSFYIMLYMFILLCYDSLYNIINILVIWMMLCILLQWYKEKDSDQPRQNDELVPKGEAVTGTITGTSAQWKLPQFCNTEKCLNIMFTEPLVFVCVVYVVESFRLNSVVAFDAMFV